MTGRSTLLTLPFALGVGALMTFAGWQVAQADLGLTLVSSSQTLEVSEAHAALTRASRAASDAEARATQLDREAAEATLVAEKTAREAAALAARIQQSEAELIGAQARLALISDRRRQLDARLAERQQPLVQLTGALQNMARRPLVLSALQPGSLKDTVYVRAVLETTMPEIRQRTAGLRTELEQGRELELAAAQTFASLQRQEEQLSQRRAELVQLETQQRATSREARQLAQREGQRALELAENARDLDGLVGELSRAGSLRQELAALPGPIMRPARPAESQVMQATAPQALPTSLPSAIQLPVQGRTITGFGEDDAAGQASTGLIIAPGAGAQVIAPAAGRVAFAGPYRGFGRIVIIEHGNGWTSLVTGLAQTSLSAGDEVIGGSPLGNAGHRDPEVMLELRRDGVPVNPLDYI